MTKAAASITEASEDWIKSRVRVGKLGPRSVRVYRQHHKSFANHVGDKAIGDVTFDDAVSWQEAHLAHLTPTTHYSRLSAMLVMFDWLAINDVLPSNVFRKLERPTRKAKAQRRPAEVDTVKRLHAIAPPRERLMIELASVLGLRRFEIAKLKRSDFSDSAGILYVVGKGNKPAELTVPTWLIGSISAYCEAFEIGPTGWLFPSRRKGEPMTPGQVGRLMTELSHRANVHVTPHQYRHMAGTEANRLHGLKHAQMLLRHSSSSTTDTYVHADTEEMRSTTEGLGMLMGWSPSDPEAA